jgi:hypothetical protein
MPTQKNYSRLWLTAHRSYIDWVERLAASQHRTVCSTMEYALALLGQSLQFEPPPARLIPPPRPTGKRRPDHKPQPVRNQSPADPDNSNSILVRNSGGWDERVL